MGFPVKFMLTALREAIYNIGKWKLIGQEVKT